MCYSILELEALNKPPAEIKRHLNTPEHLATWQNGIFHRTNLSTNDPVTCPLSQYGILRRLILQGIRLPYIPTSFFFLIKTIFRIYFKFCKNLYLKCA